MTIITFDNSSSGLTKQNHVIYNDENPIPESLASAILLKEELIKQDETHIEKERDYKKWLEFREEYLKEVLDEKGDLVCAYCNKPHLEIGGRSKKELALNNKNPNLATIDHIHALSKGGARYDKKNLCVSCRDCNKDKADKPAETFVPKKKKKKM